MRRFCGVLVMMVWTALATDARATTVLPMNLAQMSELAEKAFVLRVDSVESSVTQGHAHDVISGTVVEPIFGDVVTSEVVTWRQFKFGVNRPMQGMPTYQPGQEYMIFLSGEASATGFQMPVGLQQGAFDVIRNRATGAALVRNGMGNMTLGLGLNVEAVAEDVAQREGLTGRLRGAEPGDRAAELKRRLRPMRTGNSLDAVRDAARFFHEEKRRGRSPSREYETSGSMSVRRPVHL